MNKKYSLIVMLALMATVSAFATQITKVGVIDRARILQTFYKESQATREIDAFKEEIQTELSRLADEIKMLEERKLVAENQGDDTRALELDNIIFDKRQYMTDYYRTKNNQLTARTNSMSQNLEFADELIKVIEFVAESQGCSIVLDIKTPGLLWWNETVVITDMVLERLQSLN